MCASRSTFLYIWIIDLRLRLILYMRFFVDFCVLSCPSIAHQKSDASQDKIYQKMYYIESNIIYFYRLTPWCVLNPIHI